MTCALAVACLLGMLSFSASPSQTAPASQAKSTAPPPTSKPVAQAASQPPDDNNPPEEDETVKPKVYPFNPLESERNIHVGNFYFRRKDYRGALSRYEDATKYNPASAEAFFKIAEAEEKLRRSDLAKIAYQRVVQLAPESKLAQEAKKKLGSGS